MNQAVHRIVVLLQDKALIGMAFYFVAVLVIFKLKLMVLFIRCRQLQRNQLSYLVIFKRGADRLVFAVNP
ncbi:hypothetical protein [Testudinibacter sp. TR-2022]|uniref:hypothetical protein n=1 Tax=Testudinibacter sp. TR-2022 TaxID=2585029 RepID=UPI001117DA95|nr:hypothetical protein [Testudinibacter sp. TR-2022]TNH06586.1 hypothetical protein FHQ30_07430 [Pasteurellaceae bacterium Phil11]TNH23091.1 hypothetical protein FHQ29_06210 [Testudinibacter sp. TR-2022]TNH25031.1 hypothetical protein FHQ27_09675 [Testudinibacter sp. TR-2022]